MITYANLNMIAGLKEIMKESFGDPEWYVDFCFKHIFNGENALVYLDEGKPVSMLILLDCDIYTGHGAKKLDYIYAVSTLNAFRRKGYSSALIAYANKNMRRDVWGTFLTPAEDSLFGFYEKSGYETAFYIKEAEVHYNDALSSNSASFRQIGGAEYKAFRDRHFMCSNYVSWPEGTMEYMANESLSTGGGAFRVLLADGRNDHVLMYRKEKERLFVKETTLDGAELDLALNALMRECAVDRAFVRLRTDSGHEGVIRPFAMYRGSGIPDISKPGYFNLPLD